MKIAVVNTRDTDEIGLKGGNQKLSEALADSLSDRGHNVDLVYVSLGRGLIWNIVKAYSSAKRMNLNKYDLVISMKFPSFCVSHPNHVCYFNQVYRQFYDMWPIFKKKFPLYFRPALNCFRGWLKYNDKRYLKRVKLFVQSKFIQDRLFEVGFRAPLIYPPSPNKYLSPKDDHFEYVLSTSILNEDRKRLSLLIKAMKNLTVKLVLAGDGPDTENYKKLAKEYGVDKKIIFTGYQNDKQLAILYQNALCLVLPSYKEDYGLVCIEAMKTGKPVITCFDSGGPLEFVRSYETGFVTHASPNHLAEKIKYFVNNPTEAKRMGKNAQEAVKEISWQKVVAELTR